MPPSLGTASRPSDGPLIASLIRYGQLDVVKALLMAGADSSVTPINLARVFEMEALARLGSEPVRVHADCLPHPFEMEALALGWARSR